MQICFASMHSLGPFKRIFGNGQYFEMIGPTCLLKGLMITRQKSMSLTSQNLFRNIFFRMLLINFLIIYFLSLNLKNDDFM